MRNQYFILFLNAWNTVGVDTPRAMFYRSKFMDGEE